jgi:hypothetical protein
LAKKMPYCSCTRSTGTVSGNSTRTRDMVSNMYMGPLPPGRRGIAFKVGALTIVLCGAGIACILWLRDPGHAITDQDVLREAVAEWHRAGEPGRGPNYQIFEQQAAQGYYDDAAATSHLFKPAEDKQWSVVELAKIRAENGDIPGAKRMVARFVGSDLGNKALKTIALIQADRGDLPGALETDPTPSDSNDVLLVFARRQIANADLDGALKTAERMDSKAAGEVFYEVGDALPQRGEQNRLRELASHMNSPEMAALFRKLARFSLTYKPEVRILQPDPCSAAYHDAVIGDFAAADSVIEQKNCSYTYFIAVQQYAVDPAGAERMLRTHADPQDLALGLDQLAIAAAKQGNIAEALRFLNDLQSPAVVGNQKNEVLAQARGDEAVHAIARCWTIKDGPKVVLKWAHSRRTTEERTWALIGVAEALGHARPQK